MNSNKAKEQFSRYYENTLDAGLRQAFERDLRENAQLAAEYRAFVTVVEGLDGLRNQAVDIPFDLHDRISARLDRSEWDTKRSSPASFLTWWRSLALGGVAAIAIVGAIASLRNSGNTGNSTANLGSIGSITGGRPVLSAIGSNLGITVRRNQSEHVAVRIGSRLVSTLNLNSSNPKAEVVNPNVRAQIMTLELQDSKQEIVLALPGSKPATSISGSGDLYELACAIADLHRTPVEVSVADLKSKVDWKLDRSDASKCVVEGTQISIEQTSTGVIKLSQP